MPAHKERLRRLIATPVLDIPTLAHSLPAHLIQSVDADVVHYFNEIRKHHYPQMDLFTNRDMFYCNAAEVPRMLTIVRNAYNGVLRRARLKEFFDSRLASRWPVAELQKIQGLYMLA